MRLTSKQAEYIQNANHRWNFKVGATGAGKSFIDSFYIIPQRIMERKGKQGISVIMGVTRETIERNVLRPMREFYGDTVGEINNRNMARIMGEDVYCLGAEKINQVSKIQGATFKYLYGDEVAKWHEDVFNFAKSRLRTPYSCFDGTLNPENPNHWLKKFLDDEDIDIYNQHYIIDDNPFYPEREREELKKEYAGTIYYDRYILGLWKQAEGAIYKQFADNPQKYLWQGELPNFMRICIGVDWGGSEAPYAFVAVGMTPDGRLIALASERHKLPQATPQEIDSLIIKFCQRVKEKYGYVEYLFPDNENIGMCNGIRTALGKAMPEISVRNTEKEEINRRISATNRIIGANKFYYTDECKSLIEALEQAVWDKEESIKKGKDIRLDDGTTPIDDLDAFEYSWQRWIREFDRR